MVPLPDRVPSGGRDEGLLVLASHGRKRELKPIELSFHVCSFLLKLMLPFRIAPRLRACLSAARAGRGERRVDLAWPARSRE